MKTENLIANAEIDINRDSEKVWEALTNPQMINKYMFGTTVVSDWKKGSEITWKGEWNGKPYEDKGYILEMKPGKLIEYSHYSPLSGLPDIPENYNTIIKIELTRKGSQTHVALSHDNNADEKSRKHSEENWGMMLESMKKLLEE